MGWVAAAIVFVAVLYKFPRYTLWAIGALAIIGIVGGGIAYLYSERATAITKAENSNVTLTISADGKRCTEASHPLSISIFNRNPFSIDAVSFRVSAHKPGHSDEIYSDYLKSDRVLREKEGWLACWALDSYDIAGGKISGYLPNELEWKIEISYLTKTKGG